jgi:hypothetical protein
MANLVAKYFNRKVTQKAYATETKAFRYIPVDKTIEPDIQAVYPYHMMESVIQKATVFAVCHCSCRMIARLRGMGCEHPTEVCIKFDEVAQYVIDRKLGKEITREQAREIIKQSEEAGLVHFVDNAIGDIKHNCNCCGCACWNVGSIKRRKIPRDALMATYFIRKTDKDECTVVVSVLKHARLMLLQWMVIFQRLMKTGASAAVFVLTNAPARQPN